MVVWMPRRFTASNREHITRSLVAAIATVIAYGTATANGASAATSRVTNAADLYRAAFAGLPKENSQDARKIEFYWETPLDAQTNACLERLRPQLDLFREATAIEHCDWGHVIVGMHYGSVLRQSDAHDLQKLVLLNVRRLVRDRRAADALEDVLRLAAMTRHVSADGSLTARLSGGAMSRMTMIQVAELLPDLQTGVVRSFAAKWRAQPPLESYADAAQREVDLVTPMFDAAAKDDPEKVIGEHGYLTWPVDIISDESAKDRDARKKAIRAMWLDPVSRAAAVETIRSLRAQAAQILRLPEDQFGMAAKAFGKRVEAECFGPVTVPDIIALHHAEARERVQRALFDAAIVVTLDGKEALSRIKDPAGDGPFECTPTDTGYILTSKLEEGRQRVALTVGPQKPR